MVSDNLRYGMMAEDGVLILVIMEYGLGRSTKIYGLMLFAISLNPCYNGIWSRTNKILIIRRRWQSLNPCYNGIWSRTQSDSGRNVTPYMVLILVIMEYGLGQSGLSHDTEAVH